MYVQEATTQTNYALTATEAAMKAEPSSALQRVLNEHGEQLEKLSLLVYAVMNRLESVRTQQNQMSATESANMLADPVPGNSQLTSQVLLQTQIVRNLQSLLDLLQNDLEV